MTMQEAQARTILLLAAAAFGVWLLMCAAAELARTEARAEQAVIRADVAAWEVSRLLQEARDITQAAALERGEQP
jgi:hypothetical protein